MKWQILWSILAVLCILYGITVFMAGSGTGFFVVWLAGGAAFFLMAFFAKISLWSSLPFAAKAALLIFLALCLAVFVFIEIRIIGAFTQPPAEDLDCLIVLGAQVRDDGPSITLSYRLDTAAAYLKDHPETRCIVSGGQGYNEPAPEAAVMRDYLTAKGIDGSRIVVEDRSSNTNENIEFSKAFFDPENERVGIVTNNFHIYRACAIAKKAGTAHVAAVPAPSIPLYLPNNLVREFLGVLKDISVGNMEL